MLVVPSLRVTLCAERGGERVTVTGAAWLASGVELGNPIVAVMEAGVFAGTGVDGAPVPYPDVAVTLTE